MSTIRIKVKKINPFAFLWTAIKTRCWFLGFTWGMEARVYELRLPFGWGARMRDKTIIHEWGHLMINAGRIKGMSHEAYDDLTRHGWRQDRVKVVMTQDPLKAWKYGDFKGLRD